MDKYEPLLQYLLEQRDERLTISFDEVGTIIGDSLPKSARQYASWWANDPTHVEAAAWLEAGYHSACVSLSSETVTFIRA